MSDNDPFAALTVLLDDMDRVGDHPANLSQRLLAPTVRLLAERLRAALTEAREALGEVTVTEEWACVVDDCDACGPPRRRTVVTTRRVGEWEVAQ